MPCSSWQRGVLLVIWLVSVRDGSSVHALEPYRPGVRWRIGDPCAWLERGGIFSIPKYFSKPGPFVQKRKYCFGLGRCPMTWLSPQDTQALTFKLIGTDDMRDYEFQLHFCSPIYTFHHPYCSGKPGEIAFELRQIGTWLTLDRIYCRCLGVADVERYSYSKGVLPKNKVFRGNYFHMTCAKRPQCNLDQFCYTEAPSSDGHLYGGRVPCICPKEYYCPIYFIRDKRIPQTTDDGRVVGYGIHCKRRLF